MIIHLLPVGSKGDRVCHLAGRFRMFLFQRIKETRGCRSLFLHRSRKCWVLITELANPDRLCVKRLVSRITYCNGFRSRRIIGDLNLISDQGRFRFILSALETDTGALVYFTYLMVQKCFGYNGCFLQALFPQKCRLNSSKLHGEFPHYCISSAGTLSGAGEEPLQAY